MLSRQIQQTGASCRGVRGSWSGLSASQPGLERTKIEAPQASRRPKPRVSNAQPCVRAAEPAPRD